jgi:hypothetical protein
VARGLEKVARALKVSGTHEFNCFGAGYYEQPVVNPPEKDQPGVRGESLVNGGRRSICDEV